MTFDSLDNYEIRAIVFYNETGVMAPGKDRPAAMGPSPIDDRERLDLWDSWNKSHAHLINRVFKAIEEYTR